LRSRPISSVEMRGATAGCPSPPSSARLPLSPAGTSGPTRPTPAPAASPRPLPRCGARCGARRVVEPLTAELRSAASQPCGHFGSYTPCPRPRGFAAPSPALRGALRGEAGSGAPHRRAPLGCLSPRSGLRGERRKW